MPVIPLATGTAPDLSQLALILLLLAKIKHPVLHWETKGLAGYASPLGRTNLSFYPLQVKQAWPQLLHNAEDQVTG